MCGGCLLAALKYLPVVISTLNVSLLHHSKGTIYKCVGSFKHENGILAFHCLEKRLVHLSIRATDGVQRAFQMNV